MKRILIWMIALFIGMSMTACGLIQSAVRKQMTGNDEAMVADQEILVEESSEEELDLSMYDAYGSWSEGRLWVHKTEGSYDYLDGYYGYIDEKGNLIGEWHLDTEWLQPSEYSCGYATVCTDIQYGTNYADITYHIVDKNGEAQLAIYQHTNTWYSLDEFYEQEKDEWPSFNENGIMIYTAPTDYLNDYPKPVYIIRVLDDGSLGWVKVQHSEVDGVYPEYFDDNFINGYILYYDCTYYTPDSTDYMDVYYVDEEGNTALYLSNFEYPILEAHPIENGVAEIVFRGKDGERYLLSLNLEGDWLTEPEKVTE